MQRGLLRGHRREQTVAERRQLVAEAREVAHHRACEKQHRAAPRSSANLSCRLVAAPPPLPSAPVP